MTGPDANLTKNIVASCVFKTIMNGIYLEFFKFYQPKVTGSGFLIFEWTLHDFNT
jgi:hypothetical protein